MTSKTKTDCFAYNLGKGNREYEIRRKEIGKSKLRPCIVDDKRCFFHRWGDISEIVPPSILVGGHHGGVVQTTVGIVEFENGSVHQVIPESIKFSDRETTALSD